MGNNNSTSNDTGEIFYESWWTRKREIEARGGNKKAGCIEFIEEYRFKNRFRRLGIEDYKYNLSNISRDDELNDDEDVMYDLTTKLNPIKEYDAFTSARLRDKKDFILKMVRLNGRNLGMATESLRNDREVAKVAILENYRAIYLVTEELQGNKDFMIDVIKNCHGRCFAACADTNLANDEELFLLAIENDNETNDDLNDQSYQILREASPRIKNNKQMVLKAVERNGGYIEAAPDPLKNDLDVLSTAIKTYGKALQYAPSDLKNNKQFVLDAVQQNGKAFDYASPSLQEDLDVIWAAVKTNGRMLEDVPSNLQDDKQFVLLAVQNCGWAVEYATPRLQNDFDVALTAVRKDGDAIKHISDDLSSNIEIVVSSQLQKSSLSIPPTTILLDKDYAKMKLFPYFIEKLFQLKRYEEYSSFDEPDPVLVTYYLLRNRISAVQQQQQQQQQEEITTEQQHDDDPQSPDEPASKRRRQE